MSLDGDVDVSATVDTEAVYGGHTPITTAADTSGATVDTTQSIGTTGRAVITTIPANEVDTTGILMGSTPASEWVAPDSDLVTSTTDTTLGTVDLVGLPYRAPSGPVDATSTFDTTWTNYQISDGNGANIPDLEMIVTGGNLDVSTIGAAPAPVDVLPVAPVAPTAVAEDRWILVNFTPVADPDPTCPVLGYVIASNTGGMVYVGKNATSAQFQRATGGEAYTFQVRAQNVNGDGPWSPPSTVAVTALNYDEDRPTSITPANQINPIYLQNGTIKPGSWGAPTAPGQPTVTAVSGTPGDATVAWTAPSSGQPSGGYTVTASSGQSVTAAASATSAELTGLTVTQHITITVTAIGQLQDATSVPSASYTVV